MAGTRILHISEYLSRFTDGNKGVTLSQIRDYLMDQLGCESVSTVTISRDIDQLIEMGMPIESHIGAHNTHYYYMTPSKFTVNEIRFIIDSISINKFLSASQKQTLFHKFEGLCSEADLRRLISHVSLADVAPPNLNLLQNLETVHDIIGERRKINFNYGKYNMEKQIVYYHKKRDLIPDKVVFTSNRFYLKCIDETTGKARTYRIDRMENIISGERYVPYKKSVRVVPQQGVALDIYDVEKYEVVHFRIRRPLLDDFIEMFGEFATVVPDGSGDDSEYIILRANVGISFGFYRWVMKFGSDVEILSPVYVRETFREKLCAVAKMYDIV